ncbi:peroxiredoxin [Corticibacterium sp. UT-5YL-CI-8]|nr:peroxiredoxin [Tianweitania sp. UT-5YL-CI-8]
MAELKEGQKAPDLHLPRDGGGDLNLADFHGKAVVLYFYPKDDTKGCTLEAIDFSRLKPDFEQAGALVIGVSPDSVKSHDKFKAKHKLDIDLVADEQLGVLQAYGVWAEKSMYGRKYMGVERTTVLIDKQGMVARIWNKVKVDGHAEEVLEAVRSL